MPNTVLQNRIVAEVMGHLDDFLADDNSIQEVIDVVRAEMIETAALHVEAAAQLAQARRRLTEAIVDAAARLAPPPEPTTEEEPRELDLDDFPEVTAWATSCGSGTPLVPGVLITAAAAYVVAYVASGGAVVPGPASLLRIAVLVLCFLFGLRDRG